MSIERNLFFANGNAYDIQATMAWIRRMYEQSDEEIFPAHRFEAIMTVLIDLKYLRIVDMDYMIDDPHDGCLMTLDIFFRQYGMVDHRLQYWDESVHTFELTDEETDEIDDECIEQDADDHEMMIGVQILANLNAETQDLDELWFYGHDGDDLEDSFDSFLE